MQGQVTIKYFTATTLHCNGQASHNITVLLFGENKIYLEIQKLQSNGGGSSQTVEPDYEAV